VNDVRVGLAALLSAGAVDAYVAVPQRWNPAGAPRSPWRAAREWSVQSATARAARLATMMTTRKERPVAGRRAGFLPSAIDRLLVDGTRDMENSVDESGLEALEWLIAKSMDRDPAS